MFSIHDYQARRQAAFKILPAESALMIPSSPSCVRSADVHFPYRPSSDMLYLCGYEEESAFLILISGEKQKQVLFVQKKDPTKQLWSGPVYGPEGAGELTGMDSCYTNQCFLAVAEELLKNTQRFYYSFGKNLKWDRQVQNLLAKLKSSKRIMPALHDSLKITAPLRMKKSEKELKIMRKAIHISAEAHKVLMQNTHPGKTEKELEDIFLATVRKQGAKELAYPSIVATGECACILHYTKNNQTLKDNELLLVDAGAEYQYYASDITRTFPTNGKFSKIQKNIYHSLLTIQKNLIGLLKPGVSFQSVQKKATELISNWLLEEKLLSGNLKQILQDKKYKKYFPHNVGHSIGLDVHDVSFSKNPKELLLEENFVITIEPGLYFPPHDFSLPKELRGVGLRIEDDVWITSNSAEVLSHEVPKEVDEIEALIGSSK